MNPTPKFDSVVETAEAICIYQKGRKWFITYIIEVLQKQGQTTNAGPTGMIWVFM